MNANLKLAQKFFQDCFGAICFYNYDEDGHIKFKDGREIQTLAIYFPNRLDLMDEVLLGRLRNAAGENFYNSYIGAKGMRICGINGCKIMACFLINGNHIAVKRYGALGLKGSIEVIADHFSGLNTGCINRVTADIITNNAFEIKKGMTFKEIADNFITQNSLPEMTKENGYFFPSQEKMLLSGSQNTTETSAAFVVRETIEKYFPENRVRNIASERQKNFTKLFDKLSKEEWHAYLRDMQLPIFNRASDSE